MSATAIARASILHYYERFKEEARLAQDNVHRLEFSTATRALGERLVPGGRILDVGAGAGRYAFHFAERGFPVCAVDLLPEHVRIMRERAAARPGLDLKAELADGCNLNAFADESFDAVFCMGPLYHLREAEERRRCLQECLRVLKPDGLLAATYINKFAVLALLLKDEPESLDNPALENIMRHGWVHGDASDVFFFTTRDDFTRLMVTLPVLPVDHLALDGPVGLLGDTINRLDERQFGQWMSFHWETCREPTTLGHSMHALYLGRKR